MKHLIIVPLTVRMGNKMAQYKVVEIFTSINGEGRRAGQLAVFVRFQGCNLNCSYCDTKWANTDTAAYTVMSDAEIYERIKDSGISNVTLTGGEPLLQAEIAVLLKRLAADTDLHVEIETNGSIALEPFTKIANPPSFTMDYKLPGSCMEGCMNLENFQYLTAKDTVKFVAGSREDLHRARAVIQTFDLTEKCAVYFSPVFGAIELTEMVEFMKKYRLNGVNLQLQLHKIIWDPQARGV